MLMVDTSKMKRREPSMPFRCFACSAGLLSVAFVSPVIAETYDVFLMDIQSDGRIVVASTTQNTPTLDFIVKRFSAEGELDRTFGTDGTVRTDFAGAPDGAAGVVVQPDDAIVVAGYAGGGSRHDFGLVRYRPDGTLDATFGDGGRVTTVFAEGDAAITRIALLQDGRIVAAGTAGRSIVLARYLADGRLDETFGTKGRVATTLGDRRACVVGLVLEADGRATIGIAIQYRGYTLARYEADGTSDQTFGTAGRVDGDFPDAIDQLTGLAVAEGGGLLVVGETTPRGGPSRIMLVRHRHDGTLDPGFGHGGMVADAVTVDDASGTALVVQADGRIVVVGVGQKRMLMRRLGPSGHPDPSFASAAEQGDEGLLLMGFRALADGKLLAIGMEWGSLGEVTFVRYDADGRIDPTFGTKGRVRPREPVPSDDTPGAAILAADGSLVAVGTRWDPATGIGGANMPALVRFAADGSVDRSFGTFAPGGVAMAEPFPLAAVVEQSDGGLLVAGTLQHSMTDVPKLALARFGFDGRLDPTFGDDGIVLGEIWSGPAVGLALQRDRRILVAGSAGGAMAVAAHTSAGALDASFGDAGVATVERVDRQGEQVKGALHTLAVQADGRIVGVGSSGGALAVVRLSPDGEPDTAFGERGVALIDDSGKGRASSVVVAPDGSIVVAGTVVYEGHFIEAVVRLDPDGHLDPSFGERGVAELPFSSRGAAALVLDVDGGLLVGGRLTDDFGTVFAVARLRPDGWLDREFGTEGVVTTAFAGHDGIRTLLLQADGSIIAFGETRGDDWRDFALARYSADGVLDRRFGADGRIATDLAGVDRLRLRPLAADREDVPENASCRRGRPQATGTEAFGAPEGSEERRRFFGPSGFYALDSNPDRPEVGVPPLEIRLEGATRRAVADVLDLTVSVVNRAESDVVFLQAGDTGRQPMYDLYLRDEEGGGVYRWEPRGYGCGNVNPIYSGAYLTLAPGQEHRPTEWLGPLRTASIPKPGRYTVWAEYVFCTFAPNGLPLGRDYVRTDVLMGIFPSNALEIVVEEVATSAENLIGTR